MSLVIPAFNHARFLAEAVRSALAQDYPRLELIVLDDGSTDGTAHVLDSLAGKFHWESQVNMGQSRTLARGWEMSHGEILGYLSADDVLETSAVSQSVTALLAAPDAVATYGDFKLIDPESRPVRTVRAPEYSYERMLGQALCPVGPGAFFRRSAYVVAGPWNPAYRQMPDYDFWLRLGLLGRFIHLPAVLAGFRVHEDSQTYAASTPEKAEEPVQIITHVLSLGAADNLELALRKRALASAHLVSAQLHLRAGRHARAAFHLRRAVRQSLRTVMAARTLRLLANALGNRTAYRLLWWTRNLGSSFRR